MTEGFFSASIKDYDDEVANWRFRTAELTAANWSAQATLRGNLVIKANGIIAGDIIGTRYGNRTPVSAVASDDPLAQRELKALVQYHDAVTLEVVRPFLIGCPDLTNLDPDDHAHFNIGDGDVVDALKAAIEAYVLSPALNAVVVDEITLVGRNL